MLGLTQIDKIYIDKVVLQYQANNQFASKNAEIALATKMEKRGIITYDKVIELSNKIISTPAIKHCLSNRLSFVFIDEYQDTRLYTHTLFDKLFSNDDKFYFLIGDPLQAIYRFSYSMSQLKDEVKKFSPKKFEETPLSLIKTNYPNNIINLKQNYRSSKEIVDLINSYMIEANSIQNSIKGNINIPIIFIDNNNKDDIYNKFLSIQEKYGLDTIHTRTKTEKNVIKDLFLTRSWKLLEKLYHANSIAKLEKGEYKNSSKLQEISRCLLGILGLKKTEIVIQPEDEIEWRKFCFLVLRFLKESALTDYNKKIESIRSGFNKCFNISAKKEGIDLYGSLNDFFKDSQNNNPKQDRFYSTIHSSKGLEATSVLVVAETEKELLKWINFEKANKELDDDYRIGYVAFSRARDLLSVACLETIKPKTITTLKSLNFEFSSEILK